MEVGRRDTAQSLVPLVACKRLPVLTLDALCELVEQEARLRY